MTTKTRIEVTFFAWRQDILGDGKSSASLAVSLDRGNTFADLLQKLLADYPTLKETLLDPQTGELYQDIIVVVNGTFLDLMGGNEARLKDGDKVQFLPYLPGG